MPYGIYDNGAVIAQFVVPATLRSNQPIFASDTLSLKRNVTRRTPQRWEIESKLEPLTRNANDLFVHMVVNGYSETIQIIVPQNIGVIRTRTSNSVPTATGAVGDSQVTVAGNTGVIPKGTFIRFANHSKIYMVTTALNGVGTMGIYPTLRTAVPVTTSFNHRDNVIMNALYDTDTVLGMVFEDGVLMDNGTVKIIERV